MAAFSKLVNGDVSELIEAHQAAHEIQLLTGKCIVPLDIFRNPGDITDLSLIEPLHEQLECIRIFFWQLQLSILDALVVTVDYVVFIEEVGVVAE